MQMMNEVGCSAPVLLGPALTNYALLSAGDSAIRRAGLSMAAGLVALLH